MLDSNFLNKNVFKIVVILYNITNTSTSRVISQILTNYMFSYSGTSV